MLVHATAWRLPGAPIFWHRQTFPAMEHRNTIMLWIKSEDRSEFARALEVLQNEAPQEELQVMSALVEGPPSGEFRCYTNLSTDTPAFNLFMKNHGITIYSEPGQPIVLP